MRKLKVSDLAEKSGSGSGPSAAGTTTGDEAAESSEEVVGSAAAAGAGSAAANEVVEEAADACNATTKKLSVVEACQGPGVGVIGTKRAIKLVLSKITQPKFACN